MRRLLLLLVALCACSLAQTVPYAFLVPPRVQFVDANGVPLAGGFLYSYAAGTNTPLATYHLDTLGNLTQNQNPLILDGAGMGEVRTLPQAYKFKLTDANGVQIWQVDQYQDVGQLAFLDAVLLNPAGAALQTIVGPLAASWFVGTTAHTTSPGIRVALLDPLTILDTATNPPNLVSVAPALPGQTDAIPDGGALNSTFVLSPGPPNWVASTPETLNEVILPYTNNPCDFTFIVSTAGTTSGTNPIFSTTPCGSSPATIADGTVVWTNQGVYSNANVLDCTQAGLTCKRTAYFYLEGGGCNNTTPGLGWDTFGTNSPTPLCITGTNIQKGVMSFPSAATHIQENTGSAVSASTCTTTYPATTTAGDLLEVEVAVDTSKAVSSVTDGTNAYSKAVSIANSGTDLEIWYFNGNSTSKTAGTVLTVALTGAANCALNWKEYGGTLTSGMLDQTQSNASTGTAVTTNSAITTQPVELILAALATPGNPTITPATGWTGHSPVVGGSGLTVFSQGLIQQALATQTGTMTLSTSQAYAAALATFKVNVQGTVSAQRQIALPAYFLPSAPINSAIKWQANEFPTGPVGVSLTAEIVCTADGSSDDPPFNTPVIVVPNVSQTGPVLVTTQFPNLPPVPLGPVTGCLPSGLLHYQIQRQRYDPKDVFEGAVLVNGASLQFGIQQ